MIDLPAGATSENLSIKITKRQKQDFFGPTPDQEIVGAWTFDAAAIDRGNAAVHQFSQNLTITIRLSSVQMAGMNPDGLAFWTFDAAANRLVRLPAELHAPERALVVRVNHFSDDVATATRMVDLGPLLDGHNTNLHTGSSTLSVPIEVPPGGAG